MAIMIVSSYLPYPLVNGGNIRLFNLLKYLSRKHEITLICERRPFQTDKDLKEVEKYCKKVLTVPRKKQWNLSNILLTLISHDPFLVVGHTSYAMKKLIKEELGNNKFDLIHVETFYVYQNLPETNLPVVLVDHNVEFSVYKKYVDHTVFWIRPVLNLDVAKLRKREIFSWKRAAKVVAVSDEEKKQMEELSGLSDISVVPNGVALDTFPYINKSDGKKERALFIGDFKWLENRDSLRWILEKIWPKIDPNLNLKLWVVGANIPDRFKNNKFENVVFEENPNLETREIYEKSSVLLSPIRVGGGTSFKILEAMASGVPVITTKLGAEGLGGRNMEDLLVGETDDEIVDKLKILLTDKSLYKKISSNARRLIETKYDWQKIGEKLENVYREVLNG